MGLRAEPKGLRMHKRNQAFCSIRYGLCYACTRRLLHHLTEGPTVMGVVWLDRKPSWCVPGVGTGFSEQHRAEQVILNPGSCLFLFPGFPPSPLHPHSTPSHACMTLDFSILIFKIRVFPSSVLPQGPQGSELSECLRLLWDQIILHLVEASGMRT